jgi:Fuc2NAc and GlcNAc transferase
VSAIPALIVAALAIFASGILTGGFRRYALHRGLLDHPNERSSHQTPTPRGGGVAIVITMLIALPALALLHLVAWQSALALAAGGAIAAIVGYADDHDMVTLLPRLAAHFAAAACVIGGVGRGAIVAALGLPHAFLWLAVPLGLFYLVWMLNLTNFMDGIDGLAGTETVTMCAGGAIAAFTSFRGTSGSFAVAVALAGATAGFLRWNWPPARIFMGDAGSGFLGLMLGALTLAAGSESPALAWSWLVLGGVFVVDATMTLAVRVARGETFYKAHRSHAYQHAAQRWNHKRVTIAVAVINVVWLWPWALLTAQNVISGSVALFVAYAPLVLTSIAFRAGRRAAVK